MKNGSKYRNQRECIQQIMHLTTLFVYKISIIAKHVTHDVHNCNLHAGIGK